MRSLRDDFEIPDCEAAWHLGRIGRVPFPSSGDAPGPPS